MMLNYICISIGTFAICCSFIETLTIGKHLSLIRTMIKDVIYNMINETVMTKQAIDARYKLLTSYSDSVTVLYRLIFLQVNC
jgi:hypothetical protein